MGRASAEDRRETDAEKYIRGTVYSTEMRDRPRNRWKDSIRMVQQLLGSRYGGEKIEAGVV